MSWQALLLAAVHDTPGIARAEAARQLGMSSGLATETTARLVASGLLAERPLPPAGRRGRPTTSLHPHPRGPVVAAAAITHETWRVAAVELGGTTLAATARPHRRDQREVLTAVGAELGRLHRRFGPRIQAAAVAAPGTVVGSTLVHAPNLGWHDVDLSMLCGPATDPAKAGSSRATTPPSPRWPKRGAARRPGRERRCTCTWTPASAG